MSSGRHLIWMTWRNITRIFVTFVDNSLHPRYNTSIFIAKSLLCVDINHENQQHKACGWTFKLLKISIGWLMHILILSHVSIQSKFHHFISHTCIEDISLTSKLTSQHKFWIPQVNYAIMKLSWKSQNISFGIELTNSRVCHVISLAMYLKAQWVLRILSFDRF